MDLAEIKEEVAYAATTFHCANSTATGILQHCRTLIAKVEELEAECKERVAEKMEWLGGRGALQAEVARLTAELDSRIIGNRDAQEVISRQAGMLADLRATVTRLQSSLTLSREEGRREGMMRAAEIAESFAGSNLIAAAIHSEAKGEREQHQRLQFASVSAK